MNDLIAATAAVLPGASDADNMPIYSGQLIETNTNDDGWIVLDVERIVAVSGTPRLGQNFRLPDPNNFGGLVIDAHSVASGDGG